MILQPLALSQQVLFDNDAAAGDDDSDGPSHAKLWLMPFNVLTGMLNGWPPQGLDSE